MSLAVVYTRASIGIDAPLVNVEIHLSNGLPSFSIVGLPETTVKESKERVRSALLNSNFEFPSRRITINLAPADLPKEGGRYDLAIAIGILAASKQIPDDDLHVTEFFAELSLDGKLRPVKGVLPLAYNSVQDQRSIVIAKENAMETGLVEGAKVYPATHLLEVCGHLADEQRIAVYQSKLAEGATEYDVDLADVKGQYQAKRCLEIAAAGGHNLLFIGPPGTGKTMLAKRLSTILPLLNEKETLEVASLASIVGAINFLTKQQWRKRPFRSPHHTASSVALVGGGAHPKPGEISLAHHGVLFLDELPEFDRRVLEVLREPLEAGEINIARAKQQVSYPANFQLIAAMNPCPCGYFGDSNGRCRCTPSQVQRYRQKLSGPLLDRIDLQVQVSNVKQDYLLSNKQSDCNSESSQKVRSRVIAARQRQQHRANMVNQYLSVKQIEQYCQLTRVGNQLIEQAIDKLNLSARAYHRVLKVARTIADLANSQDINNDHLMEAIGCRQVQPDK